MNTGDTTDVSERNSASSPPRLERLAEILDEYLRAAEHGLPVDREEFVSRYPDLAEPLREYLDGLELLQEVAPSIRTDRDATAQSAFNAQQHVRQLGDYTLVREIGRGGMGIVYEARQISLDRKVALKILPFAAVLDQKQILRFQNEARSAAQLHHPNIVPIHAVGIERGVHYYVMQFIEGQSLSHLLQEMRLRCGVASNEPPNFQDTRPAASLTHEPSASTTCRSFPTGRSYAHADHVRAVAQLGVQAAQALHAAHECGVLHRDVKPSNLLLDEAGKLWVTDFGLARCQTSESLTKSGEVVGTLRYMSPEQALGESTLVDQARGCLFAGRHLIRTGDAAACIRRTQSRAASTAH
jgi:serine/threonine protein kinase